MNRDKIVLGVFLAGASWAWAQTKPELTARELFYVPSGATAASTAVPKKAAVGTKTQPAVAQNTPKQTPKRIVAPETQPDAPIMLMNAAYSGPAPLGLRYSILKRQADRTWEEANPEAVFQSGDRLRVRVESNESAYLYIVARGSSGKWDVLFPQKEIHEGDNYIEANEPQVIPGRNGQWTLDEKKGEEKLFLVLSRKPVGDLDQLIYDLNQAGKPPAAVKKPATPAAKTGEPEKPAAPKRTMLAQSVSPIDDALVGRLRSQMLSRDLVFEKVNDSKAAEGKKEAALYVVEKSGKPGARLVVDLKLKHD